MDFKAHFGILSGRAIEQWLRQAFQVPVEECQCVGIDDAVRSLYAERPAMAMIYAWGPLLGLHINPAVTFAFTARGVFSPAWWCRTGWRSSPGRSVPPCSCS
jgi:hypothetical protein